MAGVAAGPTGDWGTVWTGVPSPGPPAPLLEVSRWMSECMDGCMDTWGRGDGQTNEQTHGWMQGHEEG